MGQVTNNLPAARFRSVTVLRAHPASWQPVAPPNLNYSFFYKQVIVEPSLASNGGVYIV